MKLHVLFGQRKESYSGEFAPEVLVCWDEFTVDENPDGFDAACRDAEDHVEFAATRVVEVVVDGDVIRELLVGIPTVQGVLR